MAIRIVTNVPAVEVDGLVQMMKDSGAVSVTPTPEGDGEFTVMGVFPDMERHADLVGRRGLDPTHVV